MAKTVRLGGKGGIEAETVFPNDDEDAGMSSGHGLRALSLQGGPGDDTLNVQGGADLIDGGDGDDTLVVTLVNLSKTKIVGVEHLRCWTNDLDMSSVTIRADQLNAFKDVGAGNETTELQFYLSTAGTVGANFLPGLSASLDGSSGADTISLGHSKGRWGIDGRGGNDRITTGAGDDWIFGDEGNDIIDGGGGRDRMWGGDGSDRYFVDSAGDQVIEESYHSGEDRVYASVSWTLGAGQSVEALYANAGSRGIVLKGNAAHNALHSGAGFDRLEGGKGDDRYYVNDLQDQVAEAADGGFDIIYAAGDWTLAENANVEGLAGGAGTVARTLTGNSAANVLYGGDGIDTLIGRGGDDSYRVNRIEDRVIEAAGEGFDDVRTTVSYALTRGSEIESLSANDRDGRAALNLTGNEYGQELRGNAGRNVLDGRGGADLMYGERGDDTYRVDNRGDRVFETRGNGTDKVLSSVSHGLAADQEIEILQLLASTGDAPLKLTGNAFGQTLIGNDGGNTLDGQGGTDILIGGGGNDAYIVDRSSDQVREARGGGTDKVLATSHYALKAGQEIEALQLLTSTGTASLNLTGNEFDQTLVGNHGANVLNGGSGRDLLIGRGGGDTFVFDTKLGVGMVDRIADFAVEDTIGLAKRVFSALAPGELSADSFKDLDKGEIDADDRILYKQTTGELFYDADGSGEGSAVKFALIENRAALTAADFLVGA